MSVSSMMTLKMKIEELRALEGVLGAGGTMGDPTLLAGAIGEALVTTVAGLVVSIPSLIFYNYFVSRVNRRIAEMESNVTGVVIKISGRVK